MKIYITASLCQLVPLEIFRDALSSILGTSELSSAFGSTALHQSFSRLKLLKDPILYYPTMKMSWNRASAARSPW